MKTSRAPLIVAIVLMRLPVLYVGSYLALIDPPGKAVPYGSGMDCYRAGRQLSSRLFWPLEQIDRKVRPGAWEIPLVHMPAPPRAPLQFTDNPGVANCVEVLKNDRIIYHVLDWHYVARESYPGDDDEYAEAMKTAGNVHRAEMKILADVPEVWQEGVTEQNESAVATELAALAAFHVLLRRDGLTDLEHEQKLLRLGAAAEMILDGKPITILPADDHDSHEETRPRGGKIDDDATRAREAAIVKRIVAKGKTAVLVLGGDHDLFEAIREHDDWGYVRVTPKGYPE